MTPTTPERPIVVYDGECSYCRKQVDRLRRRDLHGTFEYTPRQTQGLQERLPQLGGSGFDTGMRLVHTNGSVSVGADAVYEIARRLDGYRRLAWLYRVPGLRQFLRIVYAGVAKNRHRLAPPRCKG